MSYKDELIEAVKGNTAIQNVWFVGEDWYFNVQENSKCVSRDEVLGIKPEPKETITKTTKKTTK